ncbi:MAG: serine/threonine-protein kinase, partial [Deltaproteobacteria bacterium]
MERIVDGKYRVGPLVGRGAMGSVYRARHVLTQVEVALKLVPPNVALTPQGQERFKREVAIAALVGHPGIVRVLDAGVDPADQTHYVVMEHLVGEDLAARALRDDFTVADGVTAVRTALDPLAAAHQHGVVHRDLKPENIFLHAADDGPMQVKLLDFGIARDRKFTNTVTAEDVALGTPNYMSPEQATNARSVTPASDVWSMGVLLYWLLAGHLPFERDNAFLTLRAVCSEAPRPIAMVGGPATQALVDLTLRCLDKDPLRRPQDAAALAAALDEVLGIFRAASSQESAGYREPTTTLEMTPGPAADRAPTGERPPAAPILNAPTEPSAAP